MTEIRVDDIDELDAYDAGDPIHVRLEILSRAVKAINERDEPKLRAATFSLLNRVLDELDDHIKTIYELRERIS